MAKIKGTIVVDKERCKGCGVCVASCPCDVLALSVEVNNKGYRMCMMAQGLGAPVSGWTVCDHTVSRQLYCGIPAKIRIDMAKEIKLMKGNEVIARAAIRYGCDAYFGYPITPQSEVMETLMELKPWETTGMVVLQAESEIVDQHGLRRCGHRQAGDDLVVVARHLAHGRRTELYRGCRTAVPDRQLSARRPRSGYDPALAEATISRPAGRRPRRLPVDRAGARVGAGDAISWRWASTWLSSTVIRR